jgi:hypothetical protein
MEKCVASERCGQIEICGLSHRSLSNDLALSLRAIVLDAQQVGGDVGQDVIDIDAVIIVDNNRPVDVVDLPAPLGPRKPNTSPEETDRDRSLTAITSPYRLVRPFISMTDMEGVI